MTFSKACFSLSTRIRYRLLPVCLLVSVIWDIFRAFLRLWEDVSEEHNLLFLYYVATCRRPTKKQNTTWISEGDWLGGGRESEGGRKEYERLNLGVIGIKKYCTHVKIFKWKTKFKKEYSSHLIGRIRHIIPFWFCIIARNLIGSGSCSPSATPEVMQCPSGFYCDINFFDPCLISSLWCHHSLPPPRILIGTDCLCTPICVIQSLPPVKSASLSLALQLRCLAPSEAPAWSYYTVRAQVGKLNEYKGLKGS